jgi:RNA polymerase sigma factor (sigma-70 family)
VRDTGTETERALELLVIRCQLGERSAFETLIAQWAEPLRRHLLRVTGDAEAADDLAQDIWLGVIRGLGRLRDPARFRAWLFGIAHRRLMDRFRDLYAARLDPDVDVADLAGATDGDGARLQDDLKTGLARLPLIEREVLTLFYQQGLTLTETSAALEIPAGTVKSRLHRARAMLRDRLQDKENR